MADLITMMSAVAGQAGEEPDPDFKQTVLLLHGDGTNGAQNNTFLDSSSNNFTITRNGNTTQGSFSPFSKPDGRWGNYFDNSGDYLQISSNAAFSFGTSDFTIECWFNAASLNAIASGSDGIITMIGSVGLYVATDAVRVTQAGTAVLNNFSATLSTNTWYHLAVTRSGTDMKAFINGVQTGTTYTNSTNFSSTGNIRIGTETNQDFHGYISNLRVLKGTALYTGNFTPPTAPLTAITNTSLLTCQSNRFIDNSTNNFTITRNGDVKVTPFSPFPITTAYDPAVNGGSGYFDGSGDYLSWPSGASVAFGTGDFTVEALVYATSSVNGRYVVDARDSGNTNTWAIGFGLVSGDGKLGFFDGSTTIEQASATLVLNSWQHCVVVRSGSTLSIYLNGTRVATATNTRNINVSPTTSYIGNRYTGSNYEFPGYLSSVRIVKGSAVYDPSQTTLTVPTAPLTAITNTSLLCNFTNAGIFDNTGFNNLETVGNAQIDTTVKKYGTGSMEFDGNGDYLRIPDTDLLEFGSGNFTVEYWANFTVLPGNTGVVQLVGKNDNSSQKSWWMYIYNNGGTYQLYFSYTTNGSSSVNPFGNISITTGVWYHFAATRSGADLKLFLDGTQVGSTHNISTSIIFPGTYPIDIGGSGTGQWFLNGYIDDLRITKGIARYTANFTPPSQAFPNL